VHKHGRSLGGGTTEPPGSRSRHSQNSCPESLCVATSSIGGQVSLERSVTMNASR